MRTKKRRPQGAAWKSFENYSMKLLLCRTIPKLGIVGDIVNVSAGYARNYLVPHGLATEPTQSNIRALGEARRHAEEERAQQMAMRKELAKRLDGHEVTIHAKANEQGHLYGSVGAKEIVAALAEEQYYIETEHVVLQSPIRQLDTVSVGLKLSDEAHATLKVWVVREKEAGEGSEEGEDSRARVGMEAGDDGDETGQ